MRPSWGSKLRRVSSTSRPVQPGRGARASVPEEMQTIVGFVARFILRWRQQTRRRASAGDSGKSLGEPRSRHRIKRPGPSRPSPLLSVRGSSTVQPKAARFTRREISSSSEAIVSRGAGPAVPVVSISFVRGCAPPNTRRAVRSTSSSVVTASRKSSSVAPLDPAERLRSEST